MSFLETIFDLNWGDITALGRVVAKLPACVQKAKHRQTTRADALTAPTSGGRSDEA